MSANKYTWSTARRIQPGRTRPLSAAEQAYAGQDNLWSMAVDNNNNNTFNNSGSLPSEVIVANNNNTGGAVPPPAGGTPPPPAGGTPPPPAGGTFPPDTGFPPPVGAPLPTTAGQVIPPHPGLLPDLGPGGTLPEPNPPPSGRGAQPVAGGTGHILKLSPAFLPDGTYLVFDGPWATHYTDNGQVLGAYPAADTAALLQRMSRLAYEGLFTKGGGGGGEGGGGNKSSGGGSGGGGEGGGGFGNDTVDLGRVGSNFSFSPVFDLGNLPQLSPYLNSIRSLTEGWYQPTGLGSHITRGTGAADSLANRLSALTSGWDSDGGLGFLASRLRDDLSGLNLPGLLGNTRDLASTLGTRASNTGLFGQVSGLGTDISGLGADISGLGTRARDIGSVLGTRGINGQPGTGLYGGLTGLGADISGLGSSVRDFGGLLGTRVGNTGLFGELSGLGSQIHQLGRDVGAINTSNIFGNVRDIGSILGTRASNTGLFGNITGLGSDISGLGIRARDIGSLLGTRGSDGQPGTGLFGNMTGLGADISGLGSRVRGLGSDVYGLGSHIRDISGLLGTRASDGQPGTGLFGNMTGLGVDISGLTGRVRGLGDDIYGLGTNVRDISGLLGTREDNTGLFGGLSGLGADILGIRDNDNYIKGLRGDIANLRGDDYLGGLRLDLGSYQTNLDKLFGNEAERTGLLGNMGRLNKFMGEIDNLISSAQGISLPDYQGDIGSLRSSIDLMDERVLNRLRPEFGNFITKDLFNTIDDPGGALDMWWDRRFRDENPLSGNQSPFGQNEFDTMMNSWLGRQQHNPFEIPDTGGFVYDPTQDATFADTLGLNIWKKIESSDPWKRFSSTNFDPPPASGIDLSVGGAMDQWWTRNMPGTPVMAGDPGQTGAGMDWEEFFNAAGKLPDGTGLTDELLSTWGTGLTGSAFADTYTPVTPEARSTVVAEGLEPLELPGIYDDTEMLRGPLNQNILNDLMAANPYDTRRDAILKGQESAINKRYDEARKNLENQFAVSDNLGSPAFRASMRKLEEAKMQEMLNLESQFGQQAAGADINLRQQRLGNLASALDQEFGRTQAQLAYQDQLQRNAIADYYSYLDAQQKQAMMPYQWADEGLRLALGGIGSTVQPNLDAASQGFSNVANYFGNRASQNSQMMGNLLYGLGKFIPVPPGTNPAGPGQPGAGAPGYAAPGPRWS